MKQRILCLLLAACMLLSLGTPGVRAAEPRRHSVTITAAPMAEQGITWAVNDGLLTISGNGAVPDYAQGEAPWLEEEVFSIIIEDGITALGSNAFRGMKKLQEVTIGSGVAAMGESVFADCPVMQRVTFRGGKGIVPTNSFNGCPMLATFWFLGDMPVLERHSLSTGAGWIDVYYDFHNKTWADYPGNIASDGVGWGSYDVRPGESGS